MIIELALSKKMDFGLKISLEKICIAGIAQLGERQTEDLKVPGSIPGHGISFLLYHLIDFG